MEATQSSMKAIVCDGFGAPEVMVVGTRPMP
jgi:NADPH:quinone reductase-like Zn-dependent oxidoreductase